jgi:hypothetical protein
VKPKAVLNAIGATFGDDFLPQLFCALALLIVYVGLGHLLLLGLFGTATPLPSPLSLA